MGLIKLIRNSYNSNLMIESCAKLIKINFFDPRCRRGETVACSCLRACWRLVSLASFVLTFSRVPLRLERKLRDRSVEVFMYFHLVYSPEFFAIESGRKSTRNQFRQATELMDVIHHEFEGNPTSPPFALHPCLFDMGILLPLRKRLLGVFLGTHGCQKPKSKSCAKASFVYL